MCIAMGQRAQAGQRDRGGEQCRAQSMTGDAGGSDLPRVGDVASWSEIKLSVVQSNSRSHRKIAGRERALSVPTRASKRHCHDGDGNAALAGRGVTVGIERTGRSGKMSGGRPLTQQ